MVFGNISIDWLVGACRIMEVCGDFRKGCGKRKTERKRTRDEERDRETEKDRKRNRDRGGGGGGHVCGMIERTAV